MRPRTARTRPVPSGAGHGRDPVLVVVGETRQRRPWSPDEQIQNHSRTNSACRKYGASMRVVAVSACSEPFPKPIRVMVRMEGSRAAAYRGQAYWITPAPCTSA